MFPSQWKPLFDKLSDARNINVYVQDTLSGAMDTYTTALPSLCIVSTLPNVTRR